MVSSIIHPQDLLSVLVSTPLIYGIVDRVAAYRKYNRLAHELLDAVNTRSIEKLQSLIHQGASTWITDDSGAYSSDLDGSVANRTSLHIAVKKGRRAAVRILLLEAQGKEWQKMFLNHQDDNGKTALQLARQPSVVRQLLQAGASIQHDQETELHVRARKGHLKAVKEILKHCARQENIALSFLLPWIVNDCALIVLGYADLTVKAWVERPNRAGETPLSLAIARGDQRMVDLMGGGSRQ